MLKAKVYSLKPSKSGNHDVLTLVVSEVIETAFGKAPRIIYYQMVMELDSCTLEADAEVDLDLTQFEVEVSQLDSGISRWLRPKVA